jgi:hypothetical protein
MRIPVIRAVPATPGQRLLWLMEHYRGGESALNIPAFYLIRGELDEDALGAALTSLVRRHEALRTTYEMTGRRLLQQIRPPAPVTLVRQRISDRDELDTAMRNHVRAKIDLASTPLLATLIECAPDEFVLGLTIHHLSTDGWSGGVLSRDLGLLYQAGEPGNPADRLPAVQWQFAHFSEWQRLRFESGALAEGQRFWRSRLAGAHAPRLPGASAETRRPGLTSFTLGEDIVLGLTELCRALRVTTFTVGLALFAAVLHARTGDTDLTISSMFANRIRPESADTVGFLANLLALRLRMPRAPAYTDVLAVVRDVVLEALAHQEVPYHLVPQEPGERERGLENILFQVAAGPDYALRLGGAETTQLPPPQGIASRFDLEFALIPKGASIDGLVWYNSARFAPGWVQKLIDDYRTLAHAAAAHPECPIRSVSRGDQASGGRA